MGGFQGKPQPGAGSPAPSTRHSPPISDNHPVALPAPMQQWLGHLEHERRYSAHTLNAYRQDLVLLMRIHADTAPEHISESHIRQALARLHAQGYTPRSLARALAAWRGFYQWWAPLAGLAANPAHGVRAPKQARSLPKALSVEQAQVLLDQPGQAAQEAPANLRDQAMFEILYSSGLRLAELVSLDWRYLRNGDYESVSWLLLDEGDVIVQGKGSKTRRLPLGSKAIAATRRWLAARSQFVQPHTQANPAWQAALFLGERGKRISPRVVQLQLNKLAQRAGLPVNVHPHSLRHSFASHMLQSAQDLRAVQELLGHANISTTQIYTRLDFQHLAKAYDQAHPRAGRGKGR